MSERVSWRRVRRCPGSGPCHKVSSLGEIKSVDRADSNGRRRRGRLLSLWPDRDGYLRVSLHDEQVLVHTVVLEAFADLRPYGLEACHDPALSEGRYDCRAVVLRWDTRQENGKDKTRARKARSEVETNPSVLAAMSYGEVQ